MAYSMKKDNGKMYIFLGIAALAVFLFASSVLPFFQKELTGRSPDVMLCFVCALPAFTDIKKGGIYALGLGFMADLFITPPTSLSPFVFLLCMCISGMCQRYFSRVGSLALAICTLPSIAARSIISVLIVALTVDGANFGSAFSGLSIAGFLGDFACAIVVSYLMRFICKKLHLKIQN